MSFPLSARECRQVLAYADGFAQRKFPIAQAALVRETRERPVPSHNRRADDDLEDAFAWKEERTLSQALTLQ
jgi:hypothetical protein